MKRYFTISLTTFAFSILNVLTFFLLGIITGNTALSGIFSITYPLQFVASVLLAFFASASNIQGNKETNKNCVYTGIILGIIFGAVVFAIVAIFIDQYLVFMNIDPSVYRIFTLMAVGQLFLSHINNIISEKLYFENKDNLGNVCNLGFIILNVASVSISALITKNELAILLANLICLVIYVCVWLGFNIKKFKFDFSIVKNFKYESVNIVGGIFMLLIYLFGFKIAFGFGEEYYIAISLVTLISDPLFDATSIIGKIAKIDISQSCYNYKKALKYSSIINACYCALGIILFFALFKFYNVRLEIGLIYLSIQIADILQSSLNINLQTFMQLEYSPFKATLINLLKKGLRTLLTVVIFSPFNTDIAQITCEILGLLIYLMLRYRNFKLDENGFLIKKDKVKKIDKHKHEKVS